jgi:alpha-tubulin suppressor-like RCC1 family protein
VRWNITFFSVFNLSSHTFSTNNSGAWVNDSTVHESDLFASVSKTISLSQGNYVCGRFYFDDSAGNSLISEDSCFTVANSPLVWSASSPVRISQSSDLTYALLGYCNATDADETDVFYQYRFYKNDVMYTQGTAFKRGSISAGYSHSCGIRASDSRVLCWGDNSYGEIGDGTITTRYSPTRTSDSSPYLSVSAGTYYTCGIRANDSRVLCWGGNSNGQLGDGTISESHSPKLTSDSSPYFEVSASYYHSCGIRTNDSRVLCWGGNYEGTLGDGTILEKHIPTLTSDSSAYKSISAGVYHTCAIRANDSRVLCWGFNGDGQTGDGTTGSSNVPTLISDASAYASISAGDFHSCGIRASDSRVLCWGDNSFGELGDGTINNHLNPTLTADSSEYLSISLGEYSSCAIRTNDSRVLCWGDNGYMQIGDGTIDEKHEPTLTSDSSAYVSLDAGYYYNCGIRANDSRVLCWGDNVNGQLGEGTTEQKSVPTLTSDSSSYAARFDESAEENLKNISKVYTETGQNWTFSCRAFNIDFTAWRNSSKIEYNPYFTPTAPAGLELNSPIYSGQTLAANASGSIASGGLNLTYYYQFYNANHTIEVQNYSNNSNYLINSSDELDLIRVRSKAFDGFNYSIETEANITVDKDSLVCWFNPVSQEPDGIRDVWCNFTNRTGEPILGATISHGTYDTNDWYKYGTMSSKGWIIGYTPVSSPNQTNFTVSGTLILTNKTIALTRYGQFYFPFHHLNQTFNILLKAGSEVSILNLRVCNDTYQNMVFGGTLPATIGRAVTYPGCSGIIPINASRENLSSSNWKFVSVDITDAYNSIAGDAMSGNAYYSIYLSTYDTFTINPATWNPPLSLLPPIHNSTIEAYNLSEDTLINGTLTSDSRIHSAASSYKLNVSRQDMFGSDGFINFTQNSDFAKFNNLASFNLRNSSFTACLFFKKNAENYDSFEKLLACNNMGLYLKRDALRNAQDVVFYLGTGANLTILETLSLNFHVISDTNWHQVCGIRDSSAEKIYIYLDGQEIISKPYDARINIAAPTECKLGEDISSEGNDENFNGQMAFFFLHNDSHSSGDFAFLLEPSSWQMGLGADAENVFAVGSNLNSTHVSFDEISSKVPISYLKIYNLNANMDYNSESHLYHYNYYTSTSQLASSQGASGVNYTVLFNATYSSNSVSDIKYWYVAASSNSSCRIVNINWTNPNKTGQYQGWFVNWSVNSSVPVTLQGFETCRPDGTCHTHSVSPGMFYSSEENRFGSYSVRCFVKNDFDSEVRWSSQYNFSVGCWQPYNDYDGTKTAVTMDTHLYLCPGNYTAIPRPNEYILVNPFNKYFIPTGYVVYDGGGVVNGDPDWRTILWSYDVLNKDNNGINLKLQNAEIGTYITGSVNNLTIRNFHFYNVSNPIDIESADAQNLIIFHNTFEYFGARGSGEESQECIYLDNTDNLMIIGNNFSSFAVGEQTEMHTIECVEPEENPCENITVEQNYYPDINELDIFTDGTERTIELYGVNFTCTVGTFGSDYPYTNSFYGNFADYYPCTEKRNTPPTAPINLTLSNGTIIPGNYINASASGSTDFDNHSITYYYEFYNINHTAVVKAYSLAAAYLSVSGDSSDVIRVRSKAYDGHNYSGETESNITLGAAPIQPSGHSGSGSSGGSISIAPPSNSTPNASINTSKTAVVSPGISSPAPAKTIPDSVFFDVTLKLISSVIKSRNTISAVLGFLNFGESGNADAKVAYKILDSMGNVVYTSSEIARLSNMNESIRDFDTSALPAGEYTLVAEIKYKNQNEPSRAESTFTVSKESSVQIPGKVFTAGGNILRIFGVVFLIGISAFGVSKMLNRKSTPGIPITPDSSEQHIIINPVENIRINENQQLNEHISTNPMEYMLLLGKEPLSAELNKRDKAKAGKRSRK